MNKLFLTALVSGALAFPAYATDYTIMAPAAPGGGWDSTARTMQEAMQADAISPSVQVTNVAGAGGTIGLAQFVSQANGDPSQLIVAGYVMVGAILANQSPISLADVTPIARLTAEADVIVVPANSPIKTLDDLVAQLKANTGAVSWAGGSAGGADHIAAGLIVKAVGLDPTQVNYIAYSGGGEALAAILGGQVTVGISGASEFLPQVDAGALRVIAVTGENRIAGYDAPTLKEGGVDVAMENWRMVAAAPGITADQKATISGDIEKMVNGPAWQAALTTRGWTNAYLSGDAFDAQLAADITATSGILKEIGLVQ
jgi:putative tricarboxylic transport membrane protein